MWEEIVARMLRVDEALRRRFQEATEVWLEPARPVGTRTVADPRTVDMGEGLHSQRCGGGRRIIRKKIGAS